MPVASAATVRPSSVARTDSGSTPAPWSEIETTTLPCVVESDAQLRRGRVVHPEAERERPGAARRRACRRRSRTCPGVGRIAPATGRASPNELEVRVEVRRQPREADEVVLVAVEDDVRDRVPGEHGDPEVRDRLRDLEAVDDLGARVERVAAGRVAVAVDERLPPTVVPL